MSVEPQSLTPARHASALDHGHYRAGGRPQADDDFRGHNVFHTTDARLLGVAHHPDISVHGVHPSNPVDVNVLHPKRFDQFHKSASLNGAAFRRPASLARRGCGVHSYSSADGKAFLNPLPHIPSEPSRERAKSHGSMRRYERRQTCCAGRASSHLIAGNWSSSRKKGKAQSWGQPAPSPAFPNVRQSLGFPIRRNVARCRATSSSLCLTRPMSNLDGLRPVQFSGFKFFRAVERWRAPVRQQAAHQIFQDFTERLHRQLSNLPRSVADQHSDGAKAWDSKSQSTRCQK